MTICSKCGAEIKSKAELAGLATKQKIALYLAIAISGTYPADTSRQASVSRSMADFYLQLLVIEKEGYKVNYGDWRNVRDCYYPFILVKGLANYPNWNCEIKEQFRETKFKFSIVRKQGNEEELLRIQQHIRIHSTDQGISGITIPVNNLTDFLQFLHEANKNASMADSLGMA